MTPEVRTGGVPDGTVRKAPQNTTQPQNGEATKPSTAVAEKVAVTVPGTKGNEVGRWVEVSGGSEAEARRAAFDELGVDDSDAEVEIVEVEPLRWGRRRVHARARIRSGLDSAGSPRA
jgi:hypothetical protein